MEMKKIIQAALYGKFVDQDTMERLKAEHDRLEAFIQKYSGKLTMGYEVDRLRELKVMLNEIDRPLADMTDDDLAAEEAWRRAMGK
jgi:hypothetical protein